MARSLHDLLAGLEKLVFAAPHKGAILPRLQKLESEIHGEPNHEAGQVGIRTRLDNLEQLLTAVSSSAPPSKRRRSRSPVGYARSASLRRKRSRESRESWNLTFFEVLSSKFTEFPEHLRVMVQKQGFLLLIVKWAVPAALNGFCLFLSMFLLHVATYNYVNEMLLWEKVYELRSNGTSIHWSFSQGRTPNETSFGSLNDPVERWLGYRAVSMQVLDKVAAFFPGCFMLCVVLLLELRLWTKVMLCNALLALLKGVLGAVTTVPDSIGWNNCKARLGVDGVRYLSTKLSLGDLLRMELVGAPPHGQHLRWCADMMFSGHTYFTCLYGLALFELFRVWFARVKPGIGRAGPLIFVCVLGVGEQVLEVYEVLKSRFHYSMDVLVAIVITFLVFTNSAVCIAAKSWVMWRAPASVDTSDSVFRLFRSSGDVFIPICCIPFCCVPNRQHMFDDSDVEDLLNRLQPEDATELNKIKEELRFGEGVLISDVCSLSRWLCKPHKKHFSGQKVSFDAPLKPLLEGE